MRQYLDDIIGMIVILFMILGWIDWLWIFGIESSQSYTWWALVAYLSS